MRDETRRLMFFMTSSWIKQWILNGRMMTLSTRRERRVYRMENDGGILNLFLHLHLFHHRTLLMVSGRTFYTLRPMTEEMGDWRKMAVNRMHGTRVQVRWKKMPSSFQEFPFPVIFFPTWSNWRIRQRRKELKPGRVGVQRMDLRRREQRKTFVGSWVSSHHPCLYHHPHHHHRHPHLQAVEREIKLEKRRQG